MKNITKKQKIALIIIAIIMIAGLVVTLTIGFNFELKLQETKRIELYLQKSFEILDIKNITNEVMPDTEVIIQKVEVFEDSVSIIAKDITEEQKQQLIEKVNEKYQTEISADSIEIVTVPNTRGRDLIKPYIVTFAISTVLILVYIAIKYRKLGNSKVIIEVVLEVLLLIVLAQVWLFDIIAITRYPIGRLTMPMVIAVYIFTVLAVTTKLEKMLKDKNEENNKKSKKA